jgi:hypothetical protein
MAISTTNTFLFIDFHSDRPHQGRNLLKAALENPVLWTGMKSASAEGR